MQPRKTRRVETAGARIRIRHLLTATALTLAAWPAAGEKTDAPDTTGDAPPIQQVGEVSVTAMRGDRDPVSVAGNVTVLGREEIERSGARSVPELLRRQAGLFVTGSTGTPAGVVIEARGFNNGGALGSGLLVQVDGRRVNEADTGNTDWSLIPLDSIESIEIVRGPVSAAYGDNAVGGVIDIRTLPAEGPLRVTARGGGGALGTGDGSLRVLGTHENLTASMFVSGYKTDGYRDRSAFDTQHVDASLEYLGDGFAVGAKGGFDHNDREFPGALDPTELALPRGRRGADPDSVGDESVVESHFVQAWYEHHFGEDVQLRIEPYTAGRTDDALISTLASGQFLIDTDKRTAGIDVQLRSDVPVAGFANRLIAGFELLHDQMERSSSSIFGLNLVDSDRQVYSAYVQNEVSLTERLLATVGVRLDAARYDIEVTNIDTFGTTVGTTRPTFTEWSPRASLNYQLLDGLWGYFSYSRGFRLPNFDEDAPFFGPSPNLRPQVSDALELGFKARSDRLTGAVALYQMWVDDEILFDPTTFSNTNLDGTEHRGIELSLDVAVFDWLSLYGSYTLDDVRITQETNPTLSGSRMPLTPLHRGSVGVTASLPFEVTLGANLDLIGARGLANDFDRQLAQLPRYQVLDLTAAWRPQLTDRIRLEVTAGVYNVTDEQYDGFGARFDVGPFGGPLVPTPFVNPAPERTWRVGLGATVTL